MNDTGSFVEIPSAPDDEINIIIILALGDESQLQWHQSQPLSMQAVTSQASHLYQQLRSQERLVLSLQS